ncbi:alpha/beta hydrolase [Flavobacterium croceum]|uniref:alpha/beta hydrolase n=1 Tax=Flavobacterium croceum TaxID=370975 RepID=UPI0024A7EF0B|nr:alpha/beta hydrolase [Flavobacterium croceum]
MTRIPVYFMPGMAASSSIFEKIKLPVDQFEVFLLEWIQPLPQESLKSYAMRMAKNVTHQNAILVGVSFGGVLVQEMAEYLTVRKIIIISSVKCAKELPKKMKIAKSTKAYKILPTSLLQDVEKLIKYAFGNRLKKKLQLYEKFLHMRNKEYLDWAIEQMICWERSTINSKVVHIHGDADEVFPIQYIKDCIVVEQGTHAMILTKYKWLNTHLPAILLA